MQGANYCDDGFIAEISTSDVFGISYMNIQFHIIILAMLFRLTERAFILVNIIIAPYAANHTLPVDR